MIFAVINSILKYFYRDKMSYRVIVCSKILRQYYMLFVGPHYTRISDNTLYNQNKYFFLFRYSYFPFKRKLIKNCN